MGSTARPVNYNPQGNNNVSLTKPLLGDEADALSEKMIQNFLSYRLALPPKIRVEILNLSQKNDWRYYSSDFVRLDEDTLKGLIEELKECTMLLFCLHY